MLLKPIKKHQKTLSLPILKNNSLIGLKNQQKKVIINNVSIIAQSNHQKYNNVKKTNNNSIQQKSPNKIDLTKRLQIKINKIIYGKTQDQHCNKNVQIQQYDEDITEAKFTLQLIHQIKMQFYKYNSNISLKKIQTIIDQMKQKRLARYLWNKTINITEEKLSLLIEKYSNFFKDLNYLLNITKNTLSHFKIMRWNNIEADLKRKKDGLDKAVSKVSLKLNNCDSQVKKKIVQTVSRINPQCNANNQFYKQWSKRAQSQLKSRKIFCQLLQHEVYMKC